MLSRRFQHSSIGAVPAISFLRSAKQVGKEQTLVMHCHRAPAFQKCTSSKGRKAEWQIMELFLEQLILSCCLWSFFNISNSLSCAWWCLTSCSWHYWKKLATAWYCSHTYTHLAGSIWISQCWLTLLRISGDLRDILPRPIQRTQGSLQLLHHRERAARTRKS